MQKPLATTAHILTVIQQAKKENPVKPTLIKKYKFGLDNANWAKLLNITDWEHLQRKQVWSEFLSYLLVIEPKYRVLHTLAGSPPDFEGWNHKVTSSKDDRVDYRYWEIYDKLVVGYPEKEVLQ